MTLCFMSYYSYNYIICSYNYSHMFWIDFPSQYNNSYLPYKTSDVKLKSLIGNTISNLVEDPVVFL